ncbi:peptidoglycan editing factor PgeF [Rhizobiaceae bacterium n13]|uniref:Purine nucleoside phosphorylase n=1 Tax=Ferirhizobium litorale TaxID=2927786 RepID=A0AAE3QBP1_9HYPH|nr:peptidoglycan editing factor PgeF [Fererhizobium litorale]MDI7860890.1 peptidoglycan editing factor PgeF [Fererhizobium litorale]MDI7921038.1 peptidoglycan editing factor PgeF [Fererhizobium litorale]
MQIHASPSPIGCPILSELSGDRIRHGFFTRQGGVSEGIYRGLNVGLGSHDLRENVLHNRTMVADWFGMPLERLATVHQVHSPDVVVVDDSYDGARPQADAMVTATPGVIIGVLTADCGPILFADPESGVVGAAHAGWKGALDGVLENTIDAMIALGARRDQIRATVGPSISRKNYEVGPEFVARFLAKDRGYDTFFTPSARPGHAMFDLQGLTVKRLQDAGVQASSLGLCTYPDAERFYSYRRTTHAGEPDYGRQISAIAILEG